MEIFACVIYLIVSAFLCVAVTSDYRINAVGALMLVGGLGGMVWKAVQGSRHRKNEDIPPSEQPPTRD